ncbi:MAG: TonB-dependent receptor [Steroidobacteraceae bacterium]
MINPRPWFLTAVCLAHCVAAEPASSGAEALQEVVVSASLRDSVAESMPASVTVLGAAELGDPGVGHLEDVLPQIADLNWAAGTNRPRYLQLRGIGELEQYQGAPNPSVGFLIDGMDFSGIGGIATLLDIGQVEVLRGPQGTILGANALAGLVNIASRAPGDESELSLGAELADYATRSMSLVAGGPLGGQAAWRFAAQKTRSDGFRHNSFLGRDDTNGIDESTARLRWRWQDREERWRVDLAAMAVDANDGYDAFAFDNSRITESDKPGRDAQRSLGASARIHYRVSDGIELESLTSVADSRIDYSFDGDWSFDPAYDFFEAFARRRRNYSQDLRVLAGQWTAGLYLARLEESTRQLDLFNGDVFRALSSEYAANNTALYAERTVSFARRWFVTAGARLERRQVNYGDTDGTVLRPGETMWGGNLALGYHADERSLLYLTVARGYKAGGFNIGPLVPAQLRRFDAEYLHSIELGWKGSWPTQRLQAELALFAMQRRDEQVPSSFQVTPGDPLSFIFVTRNAASGRNNGAELSVRFAAGESLGLAASAAWLDATYRGFQLADRNLDGRRQAHAPRYQVALNADFHGPRGFTAALGVAAVDGFYFDTSHDEQAPSRVVVNASIGFRNERWSTSLWSRNLLDRVYAMRGFYFGNEPPDFAPQRYVQQADPRQIGISFSYVVK